MDKKARILSILYQLIVGDHVSVIKLAKQNEISTKSVSRDIGVIRNFLAENRDMVGGMTLEYDKPSNSYFLSKKDALQPEQILLIVKILSGSRAVSEKEFLDLMKKLFILNYSRL